MTTLNDGNGVTVEMKSKAPHHTVWLEVDYQGTAPPVELFADLEMIGWKPPVPAAPPASAIDWSTPNPHTGERFSIRSWSVEGAAAEPPKGSAARGHWTETERTLFLVSLEGVLRRHGLVEPEQDAAEDAVVVDLTELPAPPAPAAAASTAPASTAPAPTAPAAASPAGTPSPAPNPATESAQGDTTLVVRAEIRPVDQDRVAAALVPLGVSAHMSETTKTVSNSYRGSTFETTATVTMVEVLTDAQLGEITAAVLRDMGLKPTIHQAPATAVPDVHETDPDQPASSDGDGDQPMSLRVLVPASLRSTAETLLVGVAIEAPVCEPATLTVLNTYRGTTFEATEPGTKLTCTVRAGDGEALACQLASTFGFDRGDRSRLVLEATPVPSAPAAPTDQEQPRVTT